jgi:hypothetical protein
MPPDTLKELELLAYLYQARGFAEKAEEIKEVILDLRSREKAQSQEQTVQGGEEAGK